MRGAPRLRSKDICRGRRSSSTTRTSAKVQWSLSGLGCGSAPEDLSCFSMACVYYAAVVGAKGEPGTFCTKPLWSDGAILDLDRNVRIFLRRGFVQSSATLSLKAQSTPSFQDGSPGAWDLSKGASKPRTQQPVVSHSPTVNVKNSRARLSMDTGFHVGMILWPPLES